MIEAVQRATLRRAKSIERNDCTVKVRLGPERRNVFFFEVPTDRKEAAA